MEKEEDNKLAFLDVLVSNNPPNLQTSVFRKQTFTGLLTNYFSFTSFFYKMGLIPHDPPKRPWSHVAANLFTFNNKEWLIIVDY